MPARQQDWDIKITLAGVTKFFRLLQTRDRNSNAIRKLWDVQEVEPTTAFANFAQEDWQWGVGLNRAGISLDRPGHVFRYADGFGIDTSKSGKVLHGPGSTSIGTISGTVKDFLLFSNKVWILTTSNLYSWDGATLTNVWTNLDGALNLNMVKHGSLIVICTSRFSGGNSRYYTSDGVTTTARDTATAGANLVMYVLDKQLWRAHSTNLIDSTTTPTNTASWSTDITVGEGDTITNLFSLSGLLFVTNAQGIFAVAADNSVTELDKRLGTRRSTTAFSIKAGFGSDAWFSDGTKKVIHAVALDFETFDIRPDGPFYHRDSRPVSETAIEGTVSSIALDLEAVYITAKRGADVYVFKGVEVERGEYVWSPFIRIASATNNAAAVMKMTGDASPKLYLNNGTSILTYDLEDWALYNTSYEFITYYDARNDESLVKLYTRLKTFLDVVGASVSIEVFRRVDTVTGWTTLGSISSSGLNTQNAGILTNQRVQLRFVLTSSNSASHIDLRSFNLEGIVVPELRRIFDFVLVADSKPAADFLYSLRTTIAALPIMEDRRGVARTIAVLPSYPREREQEDAVLGEPVMTYHIIAQEVPA